MCTSAALRRRLCRDSYYQFVQSYWPEVSQETPVWNWHIEYLCNEIQTVVERMIAGKPRDYDLVVNVSPGSTKSILASVMLLPWIWTRMPKARHLVGTFGQDLGLYLALQCRDIVESERYKASHPEVELRRDNRNRLGFGNTRGGWRRVVTIGGKSPTGTHAHIITVDDPLDPAQALSEAELKTANQWMSQTMPSRKVNKEVTPTLLIMQRLALLDPSGARLEKADSNPVKHICLPAELSPSKGITTVPPELANNYVDGLMDPVRLSRKVLVEAKGENEFAYAGQYLQSPVSPGGKMFKTEEFRICETPPGQFHRVVRYWDKAATWEDGDFTVGVKMGVIIDGENSQFYVLDVVRGQWDAFTREKIIKQTAQIDGKKCRVMVEQEPGSSGKESAQGTVNRLQGFITSFAPVTGAKEVRAETYASQVNAGNVWLVRGPWNTKYIEEHRYFPDPSLHDDQVDASSGAYNFLVVKRTRVGGFGK